MKLFMFYRSHWGKARKQASCLDNHGVDLVLFHFSQHVIVAQTAGACNSGHQQLEHVTIVSTVEHETVAPIVVTCNSGHQIAGACNSGH